MNFKRPKEEVVDRAWIAAESALYSHLNQLSYHGSNHQPTSVVHILQSAVSQAIREAIKSVVDDVYTGEEFEQDLGLK